MMLNDGTTVFPEHVTFIEKQSGFSPIRIGDLTLFTKDGIITTLPGSYQIITRDTRLPKIKVLFHDLVSQFKPKSISLRFLSMEGTIIPGYEADYIISIIHELPKIDFSQVLSLFDKKTRNQTRRALESGFSLKKITKIEQFYPLYCSSILRLANKPKKEKYFTDLWNSLGEKLTITGAYKDKEIIGGNIYFANGHYTKLMFNFSDPRYWPQYVNNLLYHDLYCKALESNIKILDLGPSPVNDLSHLGFKLGFGGRKMPISSFMWERNPALNIYKATRRYFGRRILGLK